MQPLFYLGFRPFFLGAAVFAVISVALWAAVYLLQLPVPMAGLSSFQWHAHEMIYGYSLAVIAGFVLTAAKNWTGIRTPRGTPLMILFSLWAAARILFLFGTQLLHAAAAFDLMFALYLCVALGYPILRAKQWRQLVILSIVIGLAGGNLYFYLGALGYISAGVHTAVYAGLYLLISLVLIMSTRVVPFFIERGVGYQVRLFTSRWVDFPSIAFLVGFVYAELFYEGANYSAYLAFCVFAVGTVRLIGWHTPGIWRAPLLWSLYVSVWLIDIGFLLFGLSAFVDVPKLIAVHTFSYGGIGMITMSMMARVSLGHTGRSVTNPPKVLNICFISLLLGLVFRTAAPLIAPDYYVAWVAVAQVLWILSFLLFIVIYVPILTRPRIDDGPG